MRNSAIIVTVNLLGRIGGPVKHTTKQRHTSKVTDGVISSVILHTDRKDLDCKKRFVVSAETVAFWASSNCPDWEDPRRWKRMSANQRIVSYVMGFDEDNLGVTFEFVENE